jgi:hypothetical protein
MPKIVKEVKHKFLMGKENRNHVIIEHPFASSC